MNLQEERFFLAKSIISLLSFASFLALFIMIWGLIHHYKFQMFIGGALMVYYAGWWAITIKDLKKGKS